MTDIQARLLPLRVLRPIITKSELLEIIENAIQKIKLIPRIPMVPTDLPFTFKRLQFPVRLAFAMAINKAQGQSLRVAGLNLGNPCFSHGQLYVACSRVGIPKTLFSGPKAIRVVNNVSNGARPAVVVSFRGGFH
ncbi:uncharacterized protein LOC135143251 [Zophobas morio]|uniref:uncharacterized protein LOC135143251 n=1 Tax=Zophobas morio TaxID=2755281 RepID=UPI003083C661